MRLAPRLAREQRLLSDARGVASVEYVIVLALVAVGATSALIALGVHLLESFLFQQALLLLPMP
jgi:Flp pilus assembly pilin Flp